MNEPLVRHVDCLHPGGLHRMAYREWRPRDGAERRTVVCVHGLTRNGGDFDRLAATLAAEGYRVVCPDIAGRGLSDRLPDAALYGVPQYVADCTTLLARLDRERVDWIGTSMGGMIGMALAGLARPRSDDRPRTGDPDTGGPGAGGPSGGDPNADAPGRDGRRDDRPGEGRPIERLLLNDIGPVLSREGLARIAGYVGRGTRYPDFASAEAALRVSMATFGPHDDEQFRLLSRHYFVERDGAWEAHYDPAIAVAFAEAPTEDVVTWPLWEAIECPVTVLRGAESDVLSAATAEAMTRGGPHGRGPRATLETLAGVGHAPTLIADGQIELVRRFLAATPDGSDAAGHR